MRGLLIFGAYVLIELLLAIWVASAIGWLAVFFIFVVSFALGIVVMTTAGRNALAALQEAGDTGTLPPGKVGDSGVLFVAGILITIPGFLTDLLGVLLVVPPLRRLSRRVAAVFIRAYFRKQGLTVVTATRDGVTETRVVPGDVVVGDVINRQDEPVNPEAQPPASWPDEPPELPR